jgi:hypothetical protein
LFWVKKEKKEKKENKEKTKGTGACVSFVLGKA